MEYVAGAVRVGVCRVPLVPVTVLPNTPAHWHVSRLPVVDHSSTAYAPDTTVGGVEVRVTVPSPGKGLTVTVAVLASEPPELVHVRV